MPSSPSSSPAKASSSKALLIETPDLPESKRSKLSSSIKYIGTSAEKLLTISSASPSVSPSVSPSASFLFPSSSPDPALPSPQQEKPSITYTEESIECFLAALPDFSLPDNLLSIPELSDDYFEKIIADDPINKIDFEMKDLKKDKEIFDFRLRKDNVSALNVTGDVSQSSLIDLMIVPKIFNKNIISQKKPLSNTDLTYAGDVMHHYLDFKRLEKNTDDTTFIFNFAPDRFSFGLIKSLCFETMKISNTHNGELLKHFNYPEYPSLGSRYLKRGSRTLLVVIPNDDIPTQGNCELEIKCSNSFGTKFLLTSSFSIPH